MKPIQSYIEGSGNYTPALTLTVTFTQFQRLFLDRDKQDTQRIEKASFGFSDLTQKLFSALQMWTGGVTLSPITATPLVEPVRLVGDVRFNARRIPLGWASADSTYEMKFQAAILSANSFSPDFAPLFSFSPSIKGGTKVGSVLTATLGAYTALPTVTSETYQWYSAGVAISGATGLTYTAQFSDDGNLITFVQSDTNSVGTTMATSNAIGPITGNLPPGGPSLDFHLATNSMYIPIINL